MLNPQDEDLLVAELKAHGKRKSWDQYFMGMAKYVATRSKDPSTQVGAVVTGPDHRIRATGYNGFASGVTESPDRTTNRDLKLLYTEHAERNAIYSAARAGVPLDGCTLYVCGLPPCADCARAIIQAGIVAVVTLPGAYPERWRESMTAAAEMLREARVTVTYAEAQNDNIGTPPRASH